MALIDHFAYEIRQKHGIEDEDWKDVRIAFSIMCVVCSSIIVYTHTDYPSSIKPTVALCIEIPPSYNKRRT